MHLVRRIGVRALLPVGAVGAALAAQWSLHQWQPGIPFPPYALGEALIRATPGALATFAIERLGHLAKPALAGAVVLALFALALIPRRQHARPFLVLLGATLLGAALAPARPSLLATFEALGIGFAAAALVLTAARAADSARPSQRTDRGRRALLASGSGAGLALLVGGPLVLARLLRTPLDTVVTASKPARVQSAPEFDAVMGLSPLLTSPAQHYVVSINFTAPALNAETWRLELRGAVERPLMLTLDDVRTLESKEHPVLLECISNPVGGELVGNGLWIGANLADVLAYASPRPGARALVITAVDGYSDVLPLAAASDVLLAYGMDGRLLTRDHGYPARLLYPRHYGMRSVKWPTRIEVTTSLPEGYWALRGWDPEAATRPGARIDTPYADARAGPSFVAAGVAWAPPGVRAVEIRLDEEREWRAAQLEAPAGELSWRRWQLRVEALPGRHLLTVRVTDADGAFQSSESLPPHPSGASGYHRVFFEVR